MVNKDMIKAAQQGDMLAQFNLGNLYYEGDGVKRDKEKAAYWFTKSAQQGHADAQYQIGWLYFAGHIEEEYDGQWRDWMEKAADQGHEEAMELFEELYSDHRSALETDPWA